ncbi:MAG: ATP-binding protein [Candidatus Gastranaerophilales bacterium]|nr:ATP-binding protein [Candidatus Gastranaerophilales bacterium]
MINLTVRTRNDVLLSNSFPQNANSNLNSKNNVLLDSDNKSNTKLPSYSGSYYIKNFNKNNQVPFQGVISTYNRDWVDWDPDKRAEEITAEAQRKINNLKWWEKLLYGMDDDIRSEARRVYEREESVSRAVLKEKLKLKNEIDEINKKAKKNEVDLAEIEQKKARLADLEAIEEENEKFHTVQPGAGWDRIGGYKKEQDILAKEFILQLAMERQEKPYNFPHAILFYGPIGNGKTTFATALAEQTKCKLVPLDPTVNSFETEIREELEEAKKRYLNEDKKRTIILINEANKFLSDKPANEDNIDFMKSVLDSCAQAPNPDNKFASGVSFFFTTNHPLKISDEIRRDGRCGTIVSLDPPEGQNAKDVFAHYIKKAIDDDKDVNYDELVENLMRVRPDAAYSNDKIKSIVLKASRDYQKDKNTPLQKHLLNSIQNNSPDIKGERLIEYQETLTEFIPRNKQD